MSLEMTLAEKVLEGLKRAPLEALSVREVKGYGRQKSYLDEYGHSEYAMAFLPKVEITMWVDDARVEEIVRTILTMARELNMPVIAEGVETPQQLGFLQSLHCQFGQGFWISRPLTATKAEETILKHSAARG